MQMPKERQPVDTETAANTWVMSLVRGNVGPDKMTTQVWL